MSDDPGDLLARLDARDPSAYDDLARWMHERPDLVEPLVLASLRGGHQDHVGVDAMVALVDEEALAGVAEAALAGLRNGAHPRKSQAASVVAELALQRVDLLRPHLREIWELGVNASYGTRPAWPWRGLDDEAEVDRLLAVVRSDESEERRQWARWALLQTRRPAVLARTIPLLDRVPHLWLRQVGFDVEGLCEWSGADDAETPGLDEIEG